MHAVIVREHPNGTVRLELAEMPYPRAAENDVVVQVHSAGCISGEFGRLNTRPDGVDCDQRSTVPGHAVSGVVVELGCGASGLSVGQRVFGVTNSRRNGTVADYVAVETRNLALLSAGVGHTLAAALAISGLTAWQGLFTHGHLAPGQTVLIHGAAGSVGSIAVQLARETGARVIGTGRAGHRQTVLGLGAESFVDLDRDRLEDFGEIDLVFDAMGDQILYRSGVLERAGATLTSIAEPPQIRPENGRAIFFVVEPDRDALAELERRVRDGRLHTFVGATYTLEEALTAFVLIHRSPGATIIRFMDDAQPTGSLRQRTG
jgi:NADPH:quinone reductase-like Zn-dependent oxidoreductase